MRDPKLWFIVLAAAAVWVYLRQAPIGDHQDSGRADSSPRQTRVAAGRVLEDKTFESYAECDSAAALAVQDLKDQGVSVALASKSALAGSTVYKVYYEGATGQISCRGGRFLNEIIEEQ